MNFSPNVPSAARIYDYFLGGKDNYPADRKVGEAVIAEMPSVRVAVQWNRAFLRRAVTYMVEAGITQIIDVGAGLPTVGPTHEVATKVNENARVVYVDRDPVVLGSDADRLLNYTATGFKKEMLHLPGKVAYLGPGGSGDVGVRFDELAPYTQLQIQNYVEELAAGRTPKVRERTKSMPPGVLIKKTT